jgi:hypothetical protein
MTILIHCNLFIFNRAPTNPKYVNNSNTIHRTEPTGTLGTIRRSWISVCIQFAVVASLSLCVFCCHWHCMVIKLDRQYLILCFAVYLAINAYISDVVA